jgi:asparagine synthase (glutamine-hydrolysing)
VATALGQNAAFADQMAHADLVLWVGEHFNPRLDRISMLHSIEARVPFQDNAVVDVAMAIPMAQKSGEGGRKALLKRAFADIIPDLARTRPKRSFQAPGAAWMEGGLHQTYRRLVDGDSLLADWFDTSQIRRYAQGFGAGTPGQVFATSALLVAELWIGRYVAGEIAA